MSVPAWATWHTPKRPQTPWATIPVQTTEGHTTAKLLSCSRGWVAVRVQGECRVYRPLHVQWEGARLLSRCTGITVRLPTGKTHQLDSSDEARLWRWVRRGIEAGAIVEGVVQSVEGQSPA